MTIKKGRRARSYRAGSRLPRQLTLGECIAIGRYAPHWADPGDPVDVDAILRQLDHMGVCTTCGWPVHRHEADADTKALLHICAQHTRDL